MMPSAKIDSCMSAPPEKRFTRSSSDAWSCCARHCPIATESTPGVGMNDPIRKNPMIMRVNRSFRRRSGVRNACANALNTASSSV